MEQFLQSAQSSPYLEDCISSHTTRRKTKRNKLTEILEYKKLLKDEFKIPVAPEEKSESYKRSGSIWRDPVSSSSSIDISSSSSSSSISCYLNKEIKDSIVKEELLSVHTICHFAFSDYLALSNLVKFERDKNSKREKERDNSMLSNELRCFILQRLVVLGEGNACERNHTKALLCSIDCSLSGCEKQGALLCKRCKLVKYCSKSHQKEDWENHYKMCKLTNSAGSKIKKNKKSTKNSCGHTACKLYCIYHPKYEREKLTIDC